MCEFCETTDVRLAVRNLKAMGRMSFAPRMIQDVNRGGRKPFRKRRPRLGS